MSSSLAFTWFAAQTWRPSGVNIEFNADNANTATQNQRALIIAQMLASGIAAPGVQFQAYSQAVVNTMCGVNSMAALKYAAYRRQDPFGEVWIGPLADNGAGTIASGSVTIVGPATAAGTLALYVMGVPLPVPVNLGDTATLMATNVAAAINAGPVPCTATSAAGVVTVTALHKGLALNDIDIRLNYVGVQNSEVTPPGVTFTVVPLSGGATNPVLSTLIANLAAMTFDYIDCPYTDSVSLSALELFLSDQSGRWSAEIELYGHVFLAYGGSFSARTTFASGRNDQHASLLTYPNGPTGSPTPAWLEASDWCAAHVVRLRVNPAQGLVGQTLNLAPPPPALVDTPGEMNILLYDGSSTFTVDPSGVCHIGRSITTYQRNASGQLDDSYLNTNLLFQAMYAARYIIGQLTTMFIDAGKILVSNGTLIGPGSPATTPNLVLGAVLGIYTYLCSQFIVQNPQTFAANATVATGSKGQLLLYLPLDFSDQVIGIAILAQFVQTT
jgi:phage tail sheath gpL-like